MAALNQRLAPVEMTNHEFPDKDRQRERTTFADGTTVTVDWSTKKA
jgi:phage baseplate assembly protein gpV